MGVACSTKAPEVDILERRLAEAAKLKHSLLKRVTRLAKDKTDLSDEKLVFQKRIEAMKIELRERDEELEDLLNDNQELQDRFKNLRNVLN